MDKICNSQFSPRISGISFTKFSPDRNFVATRHISMTKFSQKAPKEFINNFPELDCLNSVDDEFAIQKAKNRKDQDGFE